MECLKTGLFASCFWPCSPLLHCYISHNTKAYSQYYTQTPPPNLPICFWPIQLQEYYTFLNKPENKPYLNLKSSSIYTSTVPKSLLSLENRHEMRIFIFGSNNTGKTSLSKRLIVTDKNTYTHTPNYTAHTDINIDVKLLAITKNKVILLEIWDIPYICSESMFLNTFNPMCNIFLLIYDPTDLTLKSFKRMKYLYEKIMKDNIIYNKDKKIILCSSKADLITPNNQGVPVTQEEGSINRNINRPPPRQQDPGSPSPLLNNRPLSISTLLSDDEESGSLKKTNEADRVETKLDDSSQVLESTQSAMHTLTLPEKPRTVSPMRTLIDPSDPTSPLTPPRDRRPSKPTTTTATHSAGADVADDAADDEVDGDRLHPSPEHSIVSVNRRDSNISIISFSSCVSLTALTAGIPYRSPNICINTYLHLYVICTK